MLTRIKAYFYKRSIRKQLKYLITNGNVTRITLMSPDGKEYVCYKIEDKSKGESHD
jgi:hypothetical protein